MNLQDLARSVLRSYGGPELVVVRIAELNQEAVVEGYCIGTYALGYLTPRVKEPALTLDVQLVTDKYSGESWTEVQGVEVGGKSGPSTSAIGTSGLASQCQSLSTFQTSTWWRLVCTT